MRILVTGAGGMLGQDVREAAQAAGHDVTALSRLDLDIVDSAAVRRAVAAARPQVVINCAAYTDVDGAESQADTAHAVNATGAGIVAAATAEEGAWAIHVSSDYVFDGAKREPYLESDPTGPLSVYGASKLAGELAVAAAAPDSHTIVRSSWLFGAGGPCFPATMLRLAAERDELAVVDDQVGSPTFTGHLGAALVGLAGRPTPPPGILHVSAQGQCSWHEFATEILRQARASATVKPIATSDLPRPATRPAYSVLGSERTSEAPELPHWADGLTQYLSARLVAR
jgi:dTDP-4-dehydrorhamnose reductase